MAGTSQISSNNSNIGIYAQGDVKIKGNIIINAPLDVKQYIQEFSLTRLIDPFKGRDQELTKLNSLFFSKNKKKLVISGIPGYGKSELAKQFGKQCYEKEIIDDVLWIKAENKEYLNESFAKLKSIYAHLKEYKVLFIFDNAENRKSIYNYEPPQAKSFYILITSREKDFYDDVFSFEIESLSPNSAIDVLKSILNQYYNEENLESYKKLAELVNNVPLGLQVTAAYVRQQMKRKGKHFNLKNYVDRISKQQQQAFLDYTIPNSVPNNYEKSLIGAISMSIEKIHDDENERKEVRILASNALFVCAYLDSDEIKIQDLLKMSNIENLIKEDPDLLIECLSYIDNFCLIKYDSDDITINIHRFIQEILRSFLNKSNPEMKLSCFTSCVQYSMNIMNLIRWRHAIIWKYTEDFETVFYDNIYLNLIKPIKETDNFLQIMDKLVEFNCVKTLKQIFENDWENQKKVKLYMIENDFLHRAAEYNSVDVMKMLIENYKIDINSEGWNMLLFISSKTPLLCAAKTGSIDAIKYLIQSNADLEVIFADGDLAKTFLFVFLELKNIKLDEIKDILELLKCNEKIKINQWGESLVHAAANARRADLVKYLVESYNMNVNHQTHRGLTPLHTIVLQCNYQSQDEVIRTVETLKQCGARLDITNSDGLTPSKLAQDLTWSKFLVPYL